MVYLLTGGTGSFGHKFTERSLRERDLRKLIIISRDEFKLYKMRQEFPDERMRFYVGDVRDEKRMRMATARRRRGGACRCHEADPGM